MKNQAKFSVQNLNLYYGDFHALKDVDMEIPEHEITAFIGPSGCGKSTFLKTINRMNDLVSNVKITGKIFCKDITVMGNIAGDITASGKVGLSKEATVKGNITAAAIGVAVGAKLEGNLSIR